MGVTQYNATAKVPDITKIITMISPEDTPLMSLFGKGEAATQVLHSWEEDALAAPAENAQVEGFEYVTSEPGDTTLKDNVTQIFFKGFKVTDTNQAVKRQNVKDFMARQMQKAMKEVALDVERAIITNASKVTGSKASARKMAGLPFWVKSNVLANKGTARALTYDLLNDMLEKIFNCGGDPDVIVVSSRNKRVLSGLLPLSTDRSQAADSKKVVHSIEVFEGDFGLQKVLVDRWMGNDRIYGLSSEYCKLSYLRPFKKVDLPKKSDAVEKAIVGELTLEMRAEKASGAVVDLNGALPVV